VAIDIHLRLRGTGRRFDCYRRTSQQGRSVNDEVGLRCDGCVVGGACCVLAARPVCDNLKDRDVGFLIPSRSTLVKRTVIMVGKRAFVKMAAGGFGWAVLHRRCASGVGEMDRTSTVSSSSNLTEPVAVRMPGAIARAVETTFSDPKGFSRLLCWR
jgi:hypothetical protein